MNDAVVRLILDLANSSKDVGELVDKLGVLRTSTQDVADTYQVLDRRTGSYAVTSTQADRATDAAVAAAVENTRAQKALSIALEETAAKQQKAGGSSKELSQRILNLGRAAQDLAQGGLGGIINNIEGIVGGGGLAAGVLTAIGTAALLATPYIKEWVKSLGAGGEKFKPMVEGLEKLSDAINRNKKEITDLKEKQELTYWELLRYKQLVGETTQLEEEQANKRAARQVQVGSSKKEQARGAAVRETIAEDFGSGDLFIESLMDTDKGRDLGLKRIEELVADAQKGQGVAIDWLEKILPKFRGAYGKRRPEQQAQNKALEDSFKKAEEIKQKEADRRAKEIEDNKRKSDLEADRKQAQMDAEAEKDKSKQTQTASKADDFMRRNLKSMKQDIMDQKGAQQVQREAREQGFQISPAEALHEYKRRQSEQASLEAQINTLLIGNQSEQGQAIAYLRAQLQSLKGNQQYTRAELREMRAQNRTGQQSGWN